MIGKEFIQDLGCAMTPVTAKGTVYKLGTLVNPSICEVEARGSGVRRHVDGRYQAQGSVMGRGFGTPGEPEVRGEGSGGQAESES